MRSILLFRWFFVTSVFLWMCLSALMSRERRARVQYLLGIIRENPAIFQAERIEALREIDMTLLDSASPSPARDSGSRVQIANLVQDSTRLYLAGRYQEMEANFAKIDALKSHTAYLEGTEDFGVRLIGSEWGNIGHLSLLDPLCKLTHLGLLTKDRRLIAIPPKACVNKSYLNYWARYFSFIRLDEARARRLEQSLDVLYESVSWFRMTSGVTDLYTAWNIAESGWIDRQPLLELSNDDRNLGNKVLEQFGLDPSSWFVSLHVREGQSGSRSASNANINTYQDAISLIIDNGGTVIRMGNPSMRPLKSRPGLIDYAHHNLRSERMDVFLWGAARFFVGTSSGPLSVPPTFGVPTLYTNCPSIGINPRWQNSFMVPKLWYDSQSGKPVQFDRVMSSGAGWSVNPDLHGLTLRDNDSQTLFEATEDMLKLTRPNSHNLTTSHLSQEQQQFNFLRGRYGHTGLATLAPSFARRFSHLIS